MYCTLFPLSPSLPIVVLYGCPWERVSRGPALDCKFNPEVFLVVCMYDIIVESPRMYVCLCSRYYLSMMQCSPAGDGVISCFSVQGQSPSHVLLVKCVSVASRQLLRLKTRHKYSNSVYHIHTL